MQTNKNVTSLLSKSAFCLNCTCTTWLKEDVRRHSSPHIGDILIHLSCWHVRLENILIRSLLRLLLLSLLLLLILLNLFDILLGLLRILRAIMVLAGYRSTWHSRLIRTMRLNNSLSLFEWVMWSLLLSFLNCLEMFHHLMIIVVVLVYRLIFLSEFFKYIIKNSFAIFVEMER